MAKLEMWMVDYLDHRKRGDFVGMPASVREAVGYGPFHPSFTRTASSLIAAAIEDALEREPVGYGAFNKDGVLVEHHKPSRMSLDGFRKFYEDQIGPGAPFTVRRLFTSPPPAQEPKPVGYINDSTILMLESGRKGEVHPAQRDGIPPHPVWLSPPPAQEQERGAIIKPLDTTDPELTARDIAYRDGFNDALSHFQPPPAQEPSEVREREAMEERLALLLCETGRVADPRRTGRALTTQEMARLPEGPFKGRARRLTREEVVAILAAQEGGER